MLIPPYGLAMLCHFGDSHGFHFNPVLGKVPLLLSYVLLRF